MPNKLNGDIRQMICTALESVGGAEYLAQQAWLNPVAFMGLVAKVMPLQLIGDKNKPIAIDFRWADADPNTVSDETKAAVIDAVVEHVADGEEHDLVEWAKPELAND